MIHSRLIFDGVRELRSLQCRQNAEYYAHLSYVYEEPYQTRYFNESIYWLFMEQLAIDEGR